MTECECEAILLGRQAVQGTANESSLAALIRLLTRRTDACRKYRLRCCREGIELLSARRHEDEGFESDDDTISQASSDEVNSNSSSCCFVDDHVLKYPVPEQSVPFSQSTVVRETNNSTSSTSSVATDSANSSGASDNDDVDTSPGQVTVPDVCVHPQPVNPLSVKTKKPSAEDGVSREFYSINDVAFCHTDVAFPKIVVWVVKTKGKTNTTVNGNSCSRGGLEAIVFQCKSVENLRDLCASYQEFSRRLKMDLQFRYPHRRKDPSIDNLTSNALTRNASNDNMKLSSDSVVSTSYKTHVAHVPTKPSAPVKEFDFRPTEGSNKFNLVQRTDDDGVTHIEVSRAVEEDLMNSLITTDDLAGPSSIISISTPDVGNLIASSATLSTISAASVSATNAKSNIGNEIESVICTDVDTSLIGERKELYLPREGLTAGVVNTSPTSSIDTSTRAESPFSIADNPPRRPERRKYVKKNSTKEKAPQPPESKHIINVKNNDEHQSKSVSSEIKKQPGIQQKVVRGQFIRVKVDQQSMCSVPSSHRTGNRLFSNDNNQSGQISYPTWNSPTSQPLKRNNRSKEEDMAYSGHRSLILNPNRNYQRRSRSSGSGRRSKSPPSRRIPMAYRYIDTVPPASTLSNRFFGKLKEIASINNAYSGSLSRRRNSSGDLPTAQFYQYLEPPSKTSSVSKSTSNLKSVIKKKSDKYTGSFSENMEPKKVTFSAYATVQVVD